MTPSEIRVRPGPHDPDRLALDLDAAFRRARRAYGEFRATELPRSEADAILSRLREDLEVARAEIAWYVTNVGELETEAGIWSIGLDGRVRYRDTRPLRVLTADDLN